jgi:hypothetical protein
MGDYVIAEARGDTMGDYVITVGTWESPRVLTGQGVPMGIAASPRREKR